ncbi:unnamed protein product [Pleuronectes platessa]|uniref:Uncharacterized protein n=1 Tax=Pleuronectes platessa TaxID=8262 RepID=A0A9N7UF89_PLEPL|nr:unnamed protein product [Pleuronectes platessa]
MPAPRHNPRQCMSTICTAGCRDQCDRERMTPVLGLRQRNSVSSGCTLVDSCADARPGQTSATEDEGFRLTPSALRQTILLSNIPPFDKTGATGHSAEDWTGGNDEE